MTAFIFMLAKDDGPAAVSRVLHELSTFFPMHEFMACDANVGGYENNILALHSATGDIDNAGTIALPDEAEVEEVVIAFRQIIEELRDWKPS